MENLQIKFLDLTQVFQLDLKLFLVLREDQFCHFQKTSFLPHAKLFESQTSYPEGPADVLLPYSLAIGK